MVTRHDGPPSVRHFGRYTVTRMLGQGGMGAVYEAVHQDLGKKVAIKTLHASFARDEMIKARFIREGQLACKLRHPNVVDIVDVGVQDDVPFMVMEYLDGEDLDHVIKREGPMPITRVVDIMLPVMAAVMVAHEEGIVHRDLKPANVYLARSRVGEVQPKVLDFGLSKMTESEDGGLTGTSVALGTPDFMAPEQVQNSRTVDGRCDQYSLGVILYETLTGKRPFASETLAENVFKVLSGTYVRPRTVRPDLPEGLESIIMRAMSVEPVDRFVSVKELARTLIPYASADARRTWEPVFGPAAPSVNLAPRPRNPTPSRQPAANTSPRSPSSAPSNPSRPSRPSVGSMSAVVDVPYTLEALTAQRASTRPTFSGAPTPVGASVSSVAPPQRSPSPAVLVLTVALGVAVVGGGVFATMRFINKPAVIQPPRPPPPPPTYHVSVSVSPSTASLQIDGVDAGVGQLSQDLPRDPRVHMLRATAPGYETGAVAFTSTSPPPAVLVLNPIVDAAVPAPRDRHRRR